MFSLALKTNFTLGELACAYQFSIAAFVGGTAYGDSHNVADPVIWGILVAYGTHCGNFEIEQRECEAAGVGCRLSSPQELAAHWTQILVLTLAAPRIHERAQQLVPCQREAFQKTLDVLIEAVDAFRTAAAAIAWISKFPVNLLAPRR